MPRDGTATRDRILDSAEAVILDRGYSGMTVDRLIEAAGLTKGAFFYHFRSKDDLAAALIRRFAERDAATWTETWARAERLATDPLDRVLVFIGLFIEMFDGLTTPHPGCLYASYVYEWQTFDPDTRDVVANSFRMWRRELGSKFEQVLEKYPPRRPADAPSLADEFTVVIEGAFVMGKAMGEPELVAAQLSHFRNYVELLFRKEEAGG
jgi:TetR/AcrR family transcriptional repressor of nem operon